MAYEEIIWTLDVFSILGAAISLYISYRIYRYNRLSAGWLAVTGGFVASIVRRTLTFFGGLPGWPWPSEILKLSERVLSAALFILFAWGLWSLLKRFESFEITQQNTLETVRTFEETRHEKAGAVETTRHRKASRTYTTRQPSGKLEESRHRQAGRTETSRHHRASRKRR